MVKRRIALIVASATLALAIPAAAAAAPPEAGDNGYCPGGEIRDYIDANSGQALGDTLRTYQETRGYTFGEGVQLFCNHGPE